MDGVFQARHRYGARLPLFVRNPSYRILEDLLAARAVVDLEGNAQPMPAVRGSRLVALPPLSSLGPQAVDKLDQIAESAAPPSAPLVSSDGGRSPGSLPPLDQLSGKGR